MAFPPVHAVIVTTCTLHICHPRCHKEMEDLGPLFAAANYTNDNKAHVLLAATGSVASIKLPNLIESLAAHDNVSIRIILTASASKFFTGQSAEQPTVHQLRSFRNVEGIYFDEDEWKKPWSRGMGILHIELRRWADLLLVAPLSANTLAKMTAGFSDNLLLSVIRAWDISGSSDDKRVRPRIFVAPAMNTAMWMHPITSKQIAILEDEWGYKGENSPGWVTVIRPMSKTLACGDVGDGAMEDWKKITSIVEDFISRLYNNRGRPV